MDYLEYLCIFLIIPLVSILILNIHKSKNYQLNRHFKLINLVLPLIILSIVALVYTTPWDNYLIMTGLWYYEKSQIIGILIGYVPIEEYIFFIMQTLLVGSFIYYLLCFQKDIQLISNSKLLCRMSLGIGIIFFWLLSIILIFIDLENTRYLSLILNWSLPPILLQVLFGGDIVWSHRKPALIVIIISTIYLSITDAFAISQGIWTIEPSTSLNWLLGGILPFEEMIFFLITNILITFGTILLLDKRSLIRIKETIKIVKAFKAS